jgi:glycosyltransferase involved in cell wall biosynthesis
LKIAAKVDAADEEYFETEIRHLLDDPLVDFIGQIGDGEKEAFLGGAAALLMPIDWPEPFGLVVIEAMACGTPVIAFPFGSMPELVEPGVNGALVESVDQAVAAVEALAALDRKAVPPIPSKNASPWLARSRTTRVCTRRWSRTWYRRRVDPRCPSKVYRSRFLRPGRPRRDSLAPGSTEPASTGHRYDESGGTPLKGRALNHFRDQPSIA